MCFPNEKTFREGFEEYELKKLLKKPDVRKCIFSTYRSWVIVNFLLSTGVRQNSLINVKIRDVDFDNSVVYVNMTKNRKPLIIPFIPLTAGSGLSIFIDLPNVATHA